MRAFIYLMQHTEPADVRCHAGRFGSVTIDGVSIEAEDPALLDALGAAFILAATQLADEKAKAKA